MRISETIYTLLEQGVSLTQEDRTHRNDIFKKVLEPLHTRFLQYYDLRYQTLEEFSSFLDKEHISTASIKERFETQHIYPNYSINAYNHLLDSLEVKSARIVFLLEYYIRDIQPCMTYPENGTIKLNYISLSGFDMTTPKIEFLTDDIIPAILELQAEIQEQLETLTDNKDKVENTYLGIQKHCLL